MYIYNPAKVAAHSGYNWKEGPNGRFLGFPTPQEVAEWLRVTASSS